MESRYILKEGMVGNTMIMVDTESDCRKPGLLACRTVDRDDRHRVLDNGAQTRFVAEQDTIGAAIDQQNQIDLMMVHDPAISSA